MNVDPKTKPRMPGVQQFPKFGSVGVLKPCCIIDADRIRALTARRPIKPTSPNCRSARQPNPAEDSTYRRGKSVQTTGTISQFHITPAGRVRIVVTLIGTEATKGMP